MNRLLCLVLMPALALAGCNRLSPDATAKADDKPATTAETPQHPVSFDGPTHRLVSSSEIPLLEQIDRENEKVVSAVTSAVVRITAMSPADAHAALFGGFPFKLPGLPHGTHPAVPSYGSGVIISKDGYIVTNDNVIAEAQSISIELRDQRTFEAHLVATDSDSDVAVLKIAANDLPALPCGD